MIAFCKGIELRGGLAVSSLVLLGYIVLGCSSGKDASDSAPVATSSAGLVREPDTAISQITQENIPGERLVEGRVTAIRSELIVIDIGNPEPLYVPLRPALEKGMFFRVGDAIVVTMNDHNAVVDYHHAGGQSHHQIIRGMLVEPLTVGQDKAVVRTRDGEHTYRIASRARAKLGAMPMGTDIVFLADETGQLVDAQLASAEAVHQSALNNKAGRLTGAQTQVPAIFKAAATTTHEMTVTVLPDHEESVLRFRPPISKLKELHINQHIILLMDEEGYVVDIASPELKPLETIPASSQ
ncbi:MAG: hypothetical protein ABI945_04495 [Nitrospirales bacterium]